MVSMVFRALGVWFLFVPAAILNGALRDKVLIVVLGQAFGIASGVVVDTHVHRLAQRMGFSREKTPEKIEADLMDAFPQSSWIEISSSIILHGRRTCPARKPKCDVCVVAAYCPKL